MHHAAYYVCIRKRNISMKKLFQRISSFIWELSSQRGKKLHTVKHLQDRLTVNNFVSTESYKSLITKENPDISNNMDDTEKLYAKQDKQTQKGKYNMIPLGKRI